MKTEAPRQTVKFTKHDLAKYPFLEQTIEYVKKLNFKIEDLTDPAYAQILQHAETKVRRAILDPNATTETRNDEIEILSFPVSTMLTVATDNSFIKKRYALAIAKHTYDELRHEPADRILAIAKDFRWDLSTNQDAKIPWQFKLNFTDYLRNTTHLRDKKWQLINRLLTQGNVFLTKDETARLLSEEVRRRIDNRLTTESRQFPPAITAAAARLNQLTIETFGKSEIEGFPEEITQEAFPPCIEALYQAFSSGRHLSHIGRFTLTSFLSNIGMPSEKITELFKSFSDYNERMTRYQVEHIAGERGSRTRYRSPSCDTLRTHGVCLKPDELCGRVRHPLAYYRKRLRLKTRS